MDLEQLTMLNVINKISDNTKQLSGKTTGSKGTSFSDLLKGVVTGSGQSDTASGLQDNGDAGDYINLLLLMSSMNNMTLNNNQNLNSDSIIEGLMNNQNLSSNSVIEGLMNTQGLNSNSIISSLLNNSTDKNKINDILEKLCNSIDDSGKLSSSAKEKLKTNLTELFSSLSKDKTDSKKLSNLVILNFLSTALKSYTETYSQSSSAEDNDNLSSDSSMMSDYMNQIVQLSINKITDAASGSNKSDNNTSGTDSELNNLISTIYNYIAGINGSETAADQTGSILDNSVEGNSTAADLNNVLANPNNIAAQNNILKSIELIKSALNISNISGSESSSASQVNKTATDTGKTDDLYNKITDILKNILIITAASGNSADDHYAKTLPIKPPQILDGNMPAVPDISSISKHDSDGQKDNNFSNTNHNLKQGFSEGDKALKMLNNIKQSGENETGSDENINSSKINQFMNMMSSLKNSSETAESVKSLDKAVVSQKTFAQDFIKTIKYMENSNVKNLTVKIEPKNLGELVIKLTTENGIMKASITASTKEGYNLLNSNLADMSNQLNNSDVKVQQLSLSMYDSSTNSHGQQSQEENRKNYNRVRSSSFLFNEDDSDDNNDYSQEDYSNLNILV